MVTIEVDKLARVIEEAMLGTYDYTQRIVFEESNTIRLFTEVGGEHLEINITGGAR